MGRSRGRGEDPSLLKQSGRHRHLSTQSSTCEVCHAVAGLSPNPRMGTHQQVREKLICTYMKGLCYTALKGAPLRALGVQMFALRTRWRGRGRVPQGPDK